MAYKNQSKRLALSITPDAADELRELIDLAEVVFDVKFSQAAATAWAIRNRLNALRIASGEMAGVDTATARAVTGFKSLKEQAGGRA
jgi:hypothetical protein